MLPLAAQGALLGLSAAAQPGPFQAYLVARSLRTGVRRALPLAIVPVLSDPPVVAVVLLTLAQVPTALLVGLRVVGGAIVLWLGAGALREALGGSGVAVARDLHEPRGIWRATLVNLTNPNVWIGWSVVMGPILVTAWREAPGHAVAFVATFYALLTSGNVALVLLAGRAAAAGPRLARALGVVSGVALLAFGAWQIARGVAGV
jgi:threonine/homoserine/homoserine lactone efflux protein